MAKRFMSMRNLTFVLHEFVEDQRTTLYRGTDRAGLKQDQMVLNAAFELARDMMHPIFEEMDREPPVLNQGNVEVHPEVRNIMQTLGEDGWMAATFPEEWNGEEMDSTLIHAVNFIFSAANYSAAVFQELTVGAARLIFTFGSDALKKCYLPSMLSGKWQGTMALTEPEAGSSLGDLKTSAVPLEDDTYSITGEKIFISAGDHNGVDNIVHLMLARIKDAPAGVKGISLFVVPKLRPDEQGNLVANDVTVNQIFHKMGYKGAPITGLTMGEKNNCIGYLVGEPNKGLFYMFQMMNGARLEVGIGATGIATAAYHAALEYVRERKQGRLLSDKKNPDQVSIIEHPDVKRMLMFQRSVSEGSLALILLCALYHDFSHDLPDDQREKFALLLDILIPVAKSFPSEMGILSTSESIQCFGGYGYCDDFPVEQHFRDTRIHPIHEGTTGIQGMDLLGRKVRMQDGKAFDLLIVEIRKTIDQATTYPEFQRDAKDLADGLEQIQTTTRKLLETGYQDGGEALLANGTIYLKMFGIFIIGWIWLAQALVACDKLKQKKVKKMDKQFYQGKIKVEAYYFANELPMINSLSQILTRQTPVTLSIEKEHFTN